MSGSPSAQMARERLVKARAFLTAGNADRACREIREAFGADPQGWPSLSEGAALLLEAEDPSCARDALEAYVRKMPAHAEAWNLLGQVRSACKDNAEAMAAFHRAHDLEPGSLAFADQWLWSLWTAGRSEEAMDFLNRQARSGSLSVLGHHLLGLVESAGVASLDESAIGHTARVCSPFAAGRAAGLFFRSRVEQVGDGNVQLAYPTADGVLFPWAGPGQLVLVAWLSGGKYAGFVARAIRRHLTPIPILVVGADGRAGQIQRRGNLRVALSILELVEWNGQAVDAFDFVDLSAGGCAVRSSAWDPQIGDRVHCHLKLYPEKVVPEGRVVRVERSADGGRRVAIRFESMDRRDEDRLARAIHQHQVELRRKGIE